jgi:hypothetical protein
MVKNTLEALTVEQRIANMDALTVRGVMERIGRQRMKLAIARYDHPDQRSQYTSQDDKLGKLQTRILEKILVSPITSLDIKQDQARKSFFR